MVAAFLTIKHGHDDIGTLHLDLYDDVVPRTVKNFVALLQGSGRLTYRNSVSHRLIPGFMAQFGDITQGDGTGGESIYGPTFDDENFIRKHERKGMLSMANSGPNTNGSQFFVTFRKTPHLDDKHVVFGHVDLEQSAHVLRKLESIKTDKGDKPLKPVVIVDCGVIIDDDEPETEETEGQKAEPLQEQEDDPAIEDEPEEDEATMTKSEALKSRLRKLKMKMNAARQLNRKALRKEGEAVGSESRQRKQQTYQEKKLKQEAWEAQNARAIEVGGELGVDAKHLVEPALASINRATRRAEKMEARHFAVHNQYERNLKRMPRTEVIESSSETFNPLMDSVDPEKEREGARRMANELFRRIEKSKKKRSKIEFDETDVSHINKRNKIFNQKISRNYDKATAEIKQNLERGTAL